MQNLLLVALGSALGGVSRYLVTGWVSTRVVSTFPWGTLTVNVVGCALIGVLAGLGDTQRFGLPPEARSFLMVGLLGGFTTFSSFSLETLRLVHDGAWTRVLGNVGLSVALCVVGVALGYRVARMFG
jgi:fluoride exporter